MNLMRFALIFCWLSLVAVGLFCPPTAEAHELRPSIATIDWRPGEDVMIEITLNLEAALAGVGAGHADTSDSPAAKEYERLRLLAPQALRAEFDRFASEFLRLLQLKGDRGSVSLTIAAVSIPEIGDTAVARISTISLNAAVAGLLSFGRSEYCFE